MKGKTRESIPQVLRWRHAVLLLWGIGATGIGCSIEQPVAPSTDFVLRIPVTHVTRTMQEIVEERSDFLTVNSDSTVELRFEREVGQVEIGDYLSIPPQESDLQTRIGAMNVPAPPPVHMDISFGDAFGGIGDLPANTPVEVPALAGLDVLQPLDLGPIRSLTVESGRIHLTLWNGFPVPLTQVMLVLIDQDRDDAIVDRIPFARLEPGDQASDAFDLGGKTVSKHLSIRITGSSPGSEEPVAIDPDARLSAEITVSPLTVAQAEAQLPEQHFEGGGPIALPDEILVTRAQIRTGDIRVTAVNRIHTGVRIQFRLEDFRDSSGEVISFPMPVPFGGTFSETITLNGVVFQPEDPRMLRASWAVDTPATDHEVVVDKKDLIEIRIETSQIVFDEVRGILNRLHVPMPEVEREVHFPEGLDNIVLEAAFLDVLATNAIGFKAQVNLRVTGVNQFNQTDTLSVEIPIPRGNPDQPEQFTISPDPGELTDFLNLLPTHLSVATDVFLGDGQTEDHVEYTHWIRVDNVIFRAPVRFEVKSDTRILTAPRDIGLDDAAIQEKLSNNLNSGALVTTIINHLPIGVGVRLYVAPDSTQVMEHPMLTVPKQEEPSFSIEPGTVDPATGRVVEPKTITREILLDKDDILMFAQAPLFSRVEISIPGTEGQAVRLVSTDFIQVIARVRVDMRMDENLLD